MYHLPTASCSECSSSTCSRLAPAWPRNSSTAAVAMHSCTYKLCLIMFLVPVVCKCHFQNTCKQTITHSIVLEQRSTTPPHCFTMHGRWVRRAPLFQHAARSTAWAQPSNSLCYICLLICIKTVSHRPIERKPLYCFSNQPYSTATMKIYKLGTVGDRSAVVKKINGEYVVSIRVMNGEFDKFVLFPPKRQVLHITFIIHRSVLKYKIFIMRMLHTFVIPCVTAFLSVMH